MGKSIKILVVDDSESIREAVAFRLEDLGYEVERAASGVEAIELFGQQKIDLLLTDFHMPEMNGLELIQAVRQMTEYKHIPILVLTTESQHDIILQAKEAGATGWLVKPFSMDKLIATIRRLIR